MYREALSISTTNDPFDSVGNGGGVGLNEQQLNDELNIVVKDFLESNIVKLIDDGNEHWSKSSSTSKMTAIPTTESSTTTTTTTTTSSSSSIISETLPPTGTESSVDNNDVHQQHSKQQQQQSSDTNQIQMMNGSRKNGETNSGNRLYRHYNSRNKDKNSKPDNIPDKIQIKDQKQIGKNSQRSPRAAAAAAIERNSGSSLLYITSHSNVFNMIFIIIIYYALYM